MHKENADLADRITAQSQNYVSLVLGQCATPASGYVLTKLQGFFLLLNLSGRHPIERTPKAHADIIYTNIFTAHTISSFMLIA